MKVLINIISNTQIAEIRESDPTFTGVIAFKGQTFVPGEWVHVSDDFTVPDAAKPYVKNVKWILRYLVRKFLRENNLHNFAQGLIDTADLYSWPVGDRTIAETVIAMAPEEEIPET